MLELRRLTANIYAWIKETDLGLNRDAEVADLITIYICILTHEQGCKGANWTQTRSLNQEIDQSV